MISAFRTSDFQFSGSAISSHKNIHRYISHQDPLTANLYSYAKNNPLQYLDFDGHDSIRERPYGERCLEMMFMGDLTDEVNAGGFVGCVVMAFFDIDFPMDIRDLIAQFTVNFHPQKLSWWGLLIINIIGLFPGLGVVKCFDQGALLVKSTFKKGVKYLDEVLGITK